jgi:DNA-binding transcriptional ArsR family regulator
LYNLLVLSASSDIFRLLADPTRRALLDLLLRREQTAKDLSSHFRASQQAVSLHLQSLRRAGVVQVRKEGRHRKYRLKADPIREVYEWSVKYRPFFDPYGHAWLMTPAPEEPMPGPTRQSGRRPARRKRWS